MSKLAVTFDLIEPLREHARQQLALIDAPVVMLVIGMNTPSTIVVIITVISAAMLGAELRRRVRSASLVKKRKFIYLFPPMISPSCGIVPSQRR